VLIAGLDAAALSEEGLPEEGFTNIILFFIESNSPVINTYL